MNSLKEIEALLYRTENNIDFYITEVKGNAALNEIGVIRGLLYAWEAITGNQKQLSEREISYIKLQQELKEIDNENNIIKN